MSRTYTETTFRKGLWVSVQAGISPAVVERLGLRLQQSPHLWLLRLGAEIERLDTPSEEVLERWLNNELADYRMVMEHCGKVYDHFSRGRISKPNTFPSEVIAVAEQLAEEDTQEAIREASIDLLEELLDRADAHDGTIGMAHLQRRIAALRKAAPR